MSIEQWRSACAASQARADAQRSAPSRRMEVEQQRRIGLAVALWLTVGLLAWVAVVTW